MGRYALLVSVGDHEDPQLAALRSTGRDVQPLAEVLGGDRAGMFLHLQSLADVSLADLRSALRTVLAGRQPDDVVVLHLSCHALVDPQERLYFAARDSRLEHLTETALAAEELDQLLLACPAVDKLLVLDCCYSRISTGTFEGDERVPLEQAVGHDYAVLSSPDTYEYVLEAAGLREVRAHDGDLTAAVAEGLTGAADLDGDSVVRLGELHAYLREGAAIGAAIQPRLLPEGRERLALAAVPRAEHTRGFHVPGRGRQPVVGALPPPHAEPPQEVAEAPMPAAGAPPEVPASSPEVAAASPEVDQQATRTVNPRLEAPPAVTVGSKFPLLVGIAATPTPGVVAQAPFEVPVATFDLTVTLLLDGFRTADGSAPVRTMQASPQAPYPAGVVDLVAVDDPALRPARSIVATYSIAGRMLGTASTSVLVVPEEENRPTPSPKAGPRQVKGWALPTEGEPDLVITVARGNDEAGRRLQWTAQSPHEEVAVPAEPVVKVLPEQSAGDWAGRVMRGVENRTDPDDLAGYLRGIQIMVGDHVPVQIWDALASAAHVSPHPAVLLTTDDPFVPWELAKVPHPWDAQRADVLGAQCSLGRWTYRSDQPEPNPTHTLDVAKVAVVKGTYRGAAQLPEAEAEADHIAATYGGVLVEAELPTVLKCIKGDPEADALHFAVHGQLDVSGLSDGILMNDRRPLSPETILGQEVGRPRLVVVNACQVGQGQEMLGDVAGVVPSFIRIGAQAVIAPLWKVNDVAAREFAERLYAAMATGRPVADVLAEERAAAAGAAAAGKPQSTVLAYLFFGHPRLTVTLPQGSGHGPATP